MLDVVNLHGVESPLLLRELDGNVVFVGVALLLDEVLHLLGWSHGLLIQRLDTLGHNLLWVVLHDVADYFLNRFGLYL